MVPSPPVIDASLPSNYYLWLVPDMTVSFNITAQIVCRVLFDALANVAVLVPLKLLRRTHELAACVLLSTMLVLNTFTMANALVWRTDADLPGQFDGRVFCDVQVYVAVPLRLVYATSILAIMLNLAQQMRLARSGGLTRREKRRRNRRQMLVIFPAAAVQLAWMYPLGLRRYTIYTVVGCKWLAYETWAGVVLFYFAHPAVALGSGYFAILTYLRYRRLSHLSLLAQSSSPLASRRAARAKRRLYFMTFLILAPYLAITLTYFAANLASLKEGMLAFSWEEIHGQDWGSVVRFPSQATDWATLYADYIPIVTSLPVMLCFGFTKDAVNEYRRALVWVGLGRWWPGLRTEWDPDRGSSAGESPLSSPEGRPSQGTNSELKSRVGKFGTDMTWRAVSSPFRFRFFTNDRFHHGETAPTGSQQNTTPQPPSAPVLPVAENPPTGTEIRSTPVPAPTLSTAGSAAATIKPPPAAHVQIWAGGSRRTPWL